MSSAGVLGYTTTVRPGHEIDGDALAHYLAERLPEAGRLLDVRQFEGGQSNPTYLLRAAGGDFVLRKKPPGALLPSAHAGRSRVPRHEGARGTRHSRSADARCCATTRSVIGTPFFVMGCVDGRVFRQPHLPGVSAADRAAMYDDMADVLARLHRVDPAAVGLADYGKPGNYYARQIERWSQQYVAAKTDDIPADGSADGVAAGEHSRRATRRRSCTATIASRT